MKRRAFNVLALVSLLLAIAVAVLLVRGMCGAWDTFKINRGARSLAINAWQGRIIVGVVDRLENEPLFYRMAPTRDPIIWFPAFEASFQEMTFAMPPRGTFTHYWQVLIADWLLVLIFSALPAVWLVARLRRRREAVGLCTNCGYDLRGSPGPACPECGAVVPAKAT